MIGTRIQQWGYESLVGDEGKGCTFLHVVSTDQEKAYRWKSIARSVVLCKTFWALDGNQNQLSCNVIFYRSCTVPRQVNNMVRRNTRCRKHRGKESHKARKSLSCKSHNGAKKCHFDIPVVTLRLVYPWYLSWGRIFFRLFSFSPTRSVILDSSCAILESDGSIWLWQSLYQAHRSWPRPLVFSWRTRQLVEGTFLAMFQSRVAFLR